MASIDKQALSRIFNSTTTSYKYLFFLSLMELQKINNFTIKKFTYHELTSMMLAYAWYPKCYFRLSFGKQDQIGKFIEKIEIPKKLNPIKTIYRKFLLNQNISLEPLLRDVPQRLIREFLLGDMITDKGSRKDYAINAKIRNLSQRKINSSSPPIYRIDKENKAIELAEIWVIFFKSNYNQLHGWGLWNWANYLQKHNPSSPSLINKLIPPTARESLIKQKYIWDSLIQADEIRCIYTNEKIKKNYHLDHFLPWSFVAHNQPWNLVPTSPEINLSKNDSIPSDAYVPSLAELHLKLLRKYCKEISGKKFKLDCGTYLEALNIGQFDKLLDGDCLTEGYIKTYRPLIEIAKNSGFPGDWKLSSP